MTRTNPSGEVDVENRILHYLEATSTEEHNAKTIARVLHLNYNTVRKALSRLFGRSLIKRPHRGFYRAVITAETILREEYRNIRLHGFKIEALCPKEGAGSFLCPPVDTRPVGNIDNPYGYTYNRVFEGRRVTITVHKKGLYEIFVSSTSNPMDFPSFTRLCSYMEGHLGDEVWIGGSPELVEIGLNVDLKTWRLDGAKSLKVQTFKNAWSQIYQKEVDVVRMEIHLTTRLSLSEAVGILHQLSQPPPQRPIFKEMDDQDRGAYR